MLNFAVIAPRQRGYSLIELMVAIAIGLIISSAVTGLVVANIRNNNATIRAMRVTEESRALNEIMTRELRRARYDASAVGTIGSGATGTTFKTIDVATSGCIKFSYDANGDGDADSGEFRMFSRQVVSGKGVIRYGQFANAGAVSCTGGSIISSDDIDVECLQFLAPSANTTITTSNAAACFSPTPSTPENLQTIYAGSMYFSMRLSLQVDGLNLVNSKTSRRTDSYVMIRSPSV